jgi:hypothetical protein
MAKNTRKPECGVVAGATISIDEVSHERADQLIKEAFRLLVRGGRITRVVPLDCLSCRAQVAIRRIVERLAEQAEAYHLSTDLTWGLYAIGQGLEDELPSEDREIWDKQFENSEHQPWVAEGE